MDIERNGLSPNDNLEHQTDEANGENKNVRSIEPRSGGTNNVDSGKLITIIDNDESIRIVDEKDGSGKNSSRSAHKRKKVCPKMRGSRYPLRSSKDGVRVLRSMSKGKSTESAASTSSTPVNPATENKRKKRLRKKPSNDEFSRTRNRVKYLLARMNYEQSLLDAYSGEGWKGQSLEKIRPEKELERAKLEILRCKFKIRELFRHIDSSLSEGRLEESLFDSEGEICSEDIHCAKCGSKDLSADNDIILCDGVCNRGFHQKCLNPPLLSEDIPPDDIGWLCPACDCKVDCIDFLNELQGIDLSIEDTWEKVFPEATAIANGGKQFDDVVLPSDDSEDDDYNPDAPDVDVEKQKEGSNSGESSSEESSSGESYSTSSPEHSNSGVLKRDMHYDNLGLPSDDSEDDDYNPDGPDPKKEVQKDGSSLDESDFTSDSDEFMGELNKTSDANEASALLLSNLKPLEFSGGGGHPKDIKKLSINSELLSISEPDINEENTLLVSGKRQREKLDYKKLYDDTYGEASSDSSDDDDWSHISKPKKVQKDDTGEGSVALPKANTRTIKNHRSSKSSKGEFMGGNTMTHTHSDELQVPQVVGSPEKTHKAELQVSQVVGSTRNKGTASPGKSLGTLVSQRLLKAFKENQYATQARKKCLAEELGVTVGQVGKWFERARRNSRAAAKEGSQPGSSTSTKATDTREIDSNCGDSQKTGRGSHRKRGKGKEQGVMANSKSGAEHGISNGNQIKITADNERQKAVQRELRKRKKGR